MPEPRRRRTARVATVVRTERLSPSMVRVVLGGDGLAAFEPSACSDSYVKVVFVHPDVPRPFGRTEDGRVAIDDLTDDPQKAPRMRSYTVRSFVDGELVLDFVVHGDAGLAGPWAARAAAGDEVLLLGPGGGYAPDPTADFHLFAGDLSALPAIAVALERLPADAQGAVLVEAHPRDRLDLEAPAGVRTTWVDEGGLVEAVRALPWPAGVVHAFVHGEAGAVRELRRYLRLELGLDLAALSISGYWRRGDDDERWRAGKRQWNAEVERSEHAAVG